MNKFEYQTIDPEVKRRVKEMLPEEKRLYGDLFGVVKTPLAKLASQVENHPHNLRVSVIGEGSGMVVAALQHEHDILVACGLRSVWRGPIDGYSVRVFNADPRDAQPRVYSFPPIEIPQSEIRSILAMKFPNTPENQRLGFDVWFNQENLSSTRDKELSVIDFFQPEVANVAV